MAVVVPELFKNTAATTLNGGINNSTTSITVTDGSVFPSTGNFRIKIDDEIFLVTARATHVLTVATRPQEGTSAATHSDLAPVTHVLTAGAIDQFLEDNVGEGVITDRQAAAKAGRLWLPNDGLQITKDDGATWRGYGPLFKFTKTPLVADFTWVNQGAASATDQGGTIALIGGGATSTNARALVKTAPATPYHIIACIKWFNYGNALLDAGLLFREAGTGELYSYSIRMTGTAGTHNFLAGTWPGPTTTLTAVLGPVVTHQSLDVFWIRIGDDGTTNRTFDMSIDGINWYNIHTVGRTSHLTADQVGFFHNSVAATGSTVAQTTLLSWEETS